MFRYRNAARPPDSAPSDWRASWPAAGKPSPRISAPALRPGCGRRVHATLPARLNLLGAGQRAAVEVEILVHELAGERRGRTGDQMPAQVSLPVGNRRRFQLFVERLEK